MKKRPPCIEMLGMASKWASPASLASFTPAQAFSRPGYRQPLPFVHQAFMKGLAIRDYRA
jgi:hypothetical protein